jgi:hypothetical protein
MLLVFPHENRREPPSLWHEFFPRSEMRWEWDSGGDNRVAELWHLRERLSQSGKVVYGKWYRGKATLISLKLFTALIRAANPDLPEVRGLTREAREILDLLEEDSPLSTKQLKRLSGLTGRAAETLYQRSLKELWSRGLIVAYGEVEEGAFPSLAIGATKVLFEDLWRSAAEMSREEAEAFIAKALPAGSAFEKFYRSLAKQWQEQAREASDEDFF